MCFLGTKYNQYAERGPPRRNENVVERDYHHRLNFYPHFKKFNIHILALYFITVTTYIVVGFNYSVKNSAFF